MVQVFDNPPVNYNPRAMDVIQGSQTFIQLAFPHQEMGRGKSNKILHLGNILNICNAACGHETFGSPQLKYSEMWALRIVDRVFGYPDTFRKPLRCRSRSAAD